jgi:signal peptidase I
VSSWLAAAAAACAFAFMLTRHQFLVVTVTGASMEPTLRQGDRVLVRRHRRGPAQVGEILVFREPGGQRAIKRVAAVAGDQVPVSVRPVTGTATIVPSGMLVMLGDGAHSGDSRHWGFIPAEHVIGQMIRKLSGKPCREQQVEIV